MPHLRQSDVKTLEDPQLSEAWDAIRMLAGEASPESDSALVKSGRDAPTRCMTPSGPGCRSVPVNLERFNALMKSGRMRVAALRKSRSPRGMAERLVGDMVDKPITRERFEELVRVAEGAMLRGATTTSALDAVRAELAGDVEPVAGEPEPEGDDEELRDWLETDER